ncbi:MAG: amino acid racemase [Lachnospiraceae bacterium]|nr:amino acid racemase [Lachnospiraceae bacterium]
MKKIGLVGGIGPASTVEYYRGIIEKCHKEQGENVYPEIVIDSVNMWQYDTALWEKAYERLGGYLISSLSNLKAAGAELAAITANTEHIIWDMVCDKFPLPVISIVDVTIGEIKRRGFNRVLVFGTTFTLRSGLYQNALIQNGITAIIPSDSDISIIGSLIYPKLENGIVIPDDRHKLISLAEKYIAQEKADAMILGCTELPLAIKPSDISVPILNTTKIHIKEIYQNAIA